LTLQGISSRGFHRCDLHYFYLFLRDDCHSLECLQEVDQILHLLRRESHLETLVIEVHHLGKIRGCAIMEVRSSRRQASQNRSFDAANIAALPI
jgi:hypothetical protein